MFNTQIFSQLRSQPCGSQWEPNVKTLNSLILTEYCGYCVLSNGIQRRALPRHQCEEIKILNIISSSGKRIPNLPRLQSHARAPEPSALNTIIDFILHPQSKVYSTLSKKIAQYVRNVTGH